MSEATPEPVPSASDAAPAPSPSVSFEPTDPDVRAAAQAAEAGKHADAARRLSKNIARIDREAALEDRMLAHALLGRHYRLSHNAAAAQREYDAVLDAWSDPKAAMQSIVGERADDPVALRRAGQALSAVGEALFAAAEVKRARALAFRIPPYRGPANDRAIKQYLTTTMKSWLVKRRALQDDAESAYKKVLEIEPVPPPRWVIASAAEVGSMLEAMPQEMQKLVVPPSIAKDPALSQAYRDALRDALEPLQKNAEAAYRQCFSYGEKYQRQDEYTKLCRKRLAALGAAP